ncbi:protein NEN2 [Citrus sinensis]|uniref:Protein NEN2 n=1 Tax=Citrus sinensis TaxID=2711 RepID=A0ACB8IJM8_CITSI|nr:protein NEN2 [Citrus sinensis]
MGPTQDRSEIAFFDVETTVPTRPGQRFAILEFGAILVCPKKLEELHNYSTLVRPADPELISSLSVRCNGITPDAVVSSPTFADIADTVFDILHGRIWAGHNILRFDCARIREAFAEIGRPAPEPKGTIDSLALLTQRFGRRAGDMKMASLATYFGLGQQTHRSLDDVRMNLEVLKYCATVLFLESSLPDIFTVNSWVSPNATTRSRSNAKSSPEGTSQNLNTPSSKFKFENASNASPPDQGKEEIHPIFSLVTQGTAEVDSVLAVTTADQPNPFDMSQLSNQMETQSLQPDDTMEDKSAPESREMCSTASVSEGSSGYAGFMEPDEVSLSSISDGVAGRPRLSFVVDISQSLCTVLDACEVIVRKLVEDSGSSSEWRHVVTRKGGFFNHPTARLHIPTVVFGNVARYATEMYQKEASGTIQKLVFVKFDAAELDSLLKPGTFVDAFLSLDPYDYQQSSLKMRTILIQQGLDAALETDEDSRAKKGNEEGSTSSGGDMKITTRRLTSLAKRLYMKMKLYTFSMKTRTTLKDHLDEFNNLILDLENVNIIFEDENRALILLSSLPDSYEHFMDTLLNERQSLTLKDMKDALKSKDLKKRTEMKDQNLSEGLTIKYKLEKKETKRRRITTKRTKLRRKRRKESVIFVKRKDTTLKTVKDCFEKKKLEKIQKESTGKAAVASEDERDTEDADVLLATDKHLTYGGKVLLGNNLACKVVGLGTVSVNMFDGVSKDLEQIMNKGTVIIKGIRMNGLYVLVGALSKPGHFWAEAVSTTAYLINRSPSSALIFKTPQEAWSGKPPDISNLKIFGCPAYAHKQIITPDSGVEKSSQLEVESVDSERSYEAKDQSEHKHAELEGYQLTKNRERRVIKVPKKYGIADLISYVLMVAEDMNGALKKNDTWILVDKPVNKKLVGSKWVFKLKEGITGVEKPRYKARLVAKGFTQRKVVDFNKVFSPVVKHSSIRILLAITAVLDLALDQMDVQTAFLHGNLAEKIFMSQLEGFIEEGTEDKVCLLKKSLYGLKQSPRQWYIGNPGKNHWEAVKWILKYLNGTENLGIMYGGLNEDVTGKVLGYVDSDFAGDLDKRRSITGFVFTLFGGAEAKWLRGLVSELELRQESVTIHCDSSSAMQLSKNPKYHERTKHIDVRMHFIREEISTGVVDVVKIPSEINLVEMLTKPLLIVKFINSLNLIGVVSL